MKFPRVTFCTALRHDVLGEESGGFTIHHPTRNPKVDPRTKGRFFGPPERLLSCPKSQSPVYVLLYSPSFCKKPTHL